MARTFDVISDDLARWLEAQPVFFVATAPLAADGLVNCSPKGNRGELVVLGERQVAYLDQTGSGVETIAHLRENGRIVVMCCAFEGPPRVVRLHGTGSVALPGSPSFDTLSSRFPGHDGVGVRAIIAVDVQRIADSCGYGVPFMTFDRHRPTMDEWAARKGPDGIAEYHREFNATSIDQLAGLPTPSEA